MSKYTIDLTDEQVRRLIDYLDSTSGVVDKQIAAQLEGQVKPTIEEPTEFGSVVHASDAEGRAFNAVRVYERAKKPWNSGTAWYGWWELKDPEVLRVGVGPQPLAEWESDLLNFQHRRDTAAAVLMAMDVDQCLIDAVVNAKPDA